MKRYFILGGGAAALEAARAIRENDPSKHGLWNVNTEKSYHETKDAKKKA